MKPTFCAHGSHVGVGVHMGLGIVRPMCPQRWIAASARAQPCAQIWVHDSIFSGTARCEAGVHDHSHGHLMQLTLSPSLLPCLDLAGGARMAMLALRAVRAPLGLPKPRARPATPRAVKQRSDRRERRRRGRWGARLSGCIAAAVCEHRATLGGQGEVCCPSFQPLSRAGLNTLASLRFSKRPMTSHLHHPLHLFTGVNTIGRRRF